MPIPDSDLLTTTSAQIPRWVQDLFREIKADTDLEFSPASRLVYIRFGEIFKKHWKKGIALRTFLEQIDITPGQYTFFFGDQDKRPKPRKRQQPTGKLHG
jgi:hydroxymethylpyrimidine pyrophosphatase-like HAD family hydrolase